MRITRSLVAAVFACLLLAGCTSQPGTATPGAGAPTGASSGSGSAGSAGSSEATIALVRERCTKCHTVDRIRAAKHDEAAWTVTIARMKGKGAKVTSAEAQSIATFLAGGGGSQL